MIDTYSYLIKIKFRKPCHVTRNDVVTELYLKFKELYKNKLRIFIPARFMVNFGGGYFTHPNNIDFEKDKLESICYGWPINNVLEWDWWQVSEDENYIYGLIITTPTKTRRVNIYLYE